MRLISFIMGIAGAYTVIGIPRTLICIGAITYKGGVEIDAKSGRVRDFVSSCGIRWGKWIPLTTFAAISILGVRRVSTMNSRAQQWVDSVDRDLDVTLLDSTHCKKLVVKSCKNESEANDVAKQVSQCLKYPIERFSPKQISRRR